MNPHEVEVHIEELVLHGFSPTSRSHMADELEAELRRLLLQRGIPGAWQNSPQKLAAGAVTATRQTSPGTAGARIAHAIYHSDLQNQANRSHQRRPRTH